MLKWSAEFETGVAFVDADHKRLIAGLNDLEAALSTGAGSKRVPQVLAFLAEYAAEHFAREEACMLRYQCPMAQANKAAHREFGAMVAAARSRIEKSSSAAALVAIQVHRELSDWIVTHILRIDTSLKACRPAGETANAGR